jgi:multiple sugar transport system substrate-binding protein
MARSHTLGSRAAALVGALALAAGLMAACSGGGASGESTGSGASGDAAGSTDQTLTITSSYIKGHAIGDLFYDAMEDFTAETGIEVDIQEALNEELAQAYEAARLAGEETDIVLTNYTPLTRTWVEQGQSVDVAPLIEEWGLTDRIKPEALAEWTNASDQVSAFPYTSFTWPIWYNTDLLEQAGVSEVPQTVDELIAATEALRAADIQPFAVGGGDWSGVNFFTWLVQQYVDPDATKDLFTNGGYCESEGARRGIELITQLRDAGVFVDDMEGFTADSMTTSYFNGELAMMPSGSWAFETAPEEIVQSTVVSGFPTADRSVYTKPTQFEGHTSTGIWISPNGERKLDLARQFVEFMYAPEKITRFVEEAQMIPSVVPEGDVEPRNPLLAQAFDLEDQVDFLVMPDNFVPPSVDMTPVTTELYGGAGVDETCAGIDQIYAEQ